MLGFEFFDEAGGKDARVNASFHQGADDVGEGVEQKSLLPKEAFRIVALPLNFSLRGQPSVDGVGKTGSHSFSPQVGEGSHVVSVCPHHEDRCDGSGGILRFRPLSRRDVLEAEGLNKVEIDAAGGNEKVRLGSLDVRARVDGRQRLNVDCRVGKGVCDAVYRLQNERRSDRRIQRFQYADHGCLRFGSSRRELSGFCFAGNHIRRFGRLREKESHGANRRERKKDERASTHAI